MAYITTSDIYTNNLFKITTSTADTATVTRYINYAESKINGYISKKYTLPLASTPALIKELAIDFTGYKILNDLYSGEDQSQNDWIIDNLTNCIEQIKEIGSGDLILTDTTGAMLASNRTAKYATSRDFPLVIDMDEDFDWNVSTGLLDQIESARLAAE